MDKKPSDHLMTGELGEDIAARHLIQKGFSIEERNYRKKYGEIDIVARKDNIVYFFEVKTLSREVNSFGEGIFKPEDMVHPWKIKRLQKVIQAYVLEKNIDADWRFGIISILLNKKDRKAKLKLILDLAL